MNKIVLASLLLLPSASFAAVTAVPEPSTYGIIGAVVLAGLIALRIFRRR